MKFFNKAWNYFEAHVFWQYLLVLVLSLFLFGYIQASPEFPDPDSFYHAKMAQLTYEQGAVKNFPWLSATNLEQDFIDHHFLYHLLLVPFVILFNPLVGVKIAAVLFASLLILVFFWFLRSFKVKGALWFTLFLLTINPFIFRLNLAKAPSLVLILFFLLINFLIFRRYFSLMLCSFIYVWLYGGWPTALGLVGIYFCLSLIWPASWRGAAAVRLGKLKIAWQTVLAMIFTVFGVTAGLILSPYFPQNIKFYWQQTFQIAIVNYQNVINVGAEWYPYSFLDLVSIALPFTIFLAIALVLFLINLRRQPLINWYLLIITIVFLGLTLKSRRYVEYFIPIAWAFTAFSFNLALKQIREFFTPVLALPYQRFIPIILLLAFAPIFFHDLGGVKSNFSNTISFFRFSPVATWLKENSQPGDIVLHSDWDEFPILFYYNDLNYYIAGLDPTFAYQYNKNLYLLWTKITAGEPVSNLEQAVSQVFRARYVFVDYHQNSAMDQLFFSNLNFKKVYQDSEAKIYETLR